MKTPFNLLVKDFPIVTLLTFLLILTSCAKDSDLFNYAVEQEIAENIENGEDGTEVTEDSVDEVIDATEDNTDREDKDSEPREDYVFVEYEESFEDFPNPERGFYRATTAFVDSYNVFDASILRSFRNGGSGAGANYSVNSTIIFRYFILSGYANQALPQSFLDNLQSDLDACRAAGLKFLPRFSYTNDGSRMNNPPYGDASKDIILQHIAQLEPYFRANADVILAIQMGFVGIWGEQIYTDYFGDPSQNLLNDSHWQSRNEIVQALLDATSKETQILLRLPRHHQVFLNGNSSSTNSSSISASEAFSGSDRARVGFHNDCFVSGSDDFQTYYNYSAPYGNQGNAFQDLRDYTAQGTKYTMNGGETCADGFWGGDCPVGDLETMRFTFLNADYNNDVNNDWVSGGCMDDIKRRLGYRYSMVSGDFPNEVERSKTYDFTLSLKNSGYAVVYSERPIEMVFRNLSNGQETKYSIPLDLRFLEKEGTIDFSLTISDQMGDGLYDIFLNIPDIHQSIYGNPDYSIRLANTNSWESSTGYNYLNHRILVN